MRKFKFISAVSLILAMSLMAIVTGMCDSGAEMATIVFLTVIDLLLFSVTYLANREVERCIHGK